MLPVMLVLGTGVGLAFPAVMALGITGATERDAGLASGLINTTVQVGGALGLAVVAALATSHTSSLREAGDPRLRALTGGYHLAATTGAGLVLAAIAVPAGLLLPARRNRASAARTRQINSDRAPIGAGHSPAKEIR